MVLHHFRVDVEECFGVSALEPRVRCEGQASQGLDEFRFGRIRGNLYRAWPACSAP